MRLARKRRERDVERGCERRAGRFVAFETEARRDAAAQIAREHQAVARYARAAIVVDRGVAPERRRLAGQNVVALLPSDEHRGRGVERGREREGVIFEDDARLQRAGARRRGPVDAARIVAAQVRAQFGELVSVGATFDRRAAAAHARPFAAGEHRRAQPRGERIQLSLRPARTGSGRAARACARGS